MYILAAVDAIAPAIAPEGYWHVKGSDIIMTVAVITGPLAAVLITVWLQNRKEKRAQERNLFLTLMAYRKSIAPTLEWARSLNLIPVVFADYPTVVALWWELFDCLSVMGPTEPQKRAQEHKYLELLSAMAVEMGYPKLQQTDIDKFYTPGAHGSMMELQVGVQYELLRVLRNSERFSSEPRADEKK